MFEEVTFETVLERMLGRIDDSYDKRESSPIYAAIAPAALEIVNMYAALSDMMDEAFADTASKNYLVRIAASRGISPYPATKAIVRAEFEPNTIEVEMESVFTGDESSYRVIEKAGAGIYKMECREAGEAGNAYIGEIMPTDYIEGLESAKITGILAYGEEEEDTEAFRRRYMDSFEAIAFGGNKADYQKKAMEIAGVGAVKVFPVWNGPGTVKLVILDTDFRKASAELAAQVQAVFDPDKNGFGDGIAPVGHIVTVDTVEEILIYTEVNIVYDYGYDWNFCKNSVESALEGYFFEVRKEWSRQGESILRINSINAAILSIQGIIDVTGTKLNGEGENLRLGSCEIPVFGGIVHE